jgi:serine/threonine protein kinase
MVQDRSSDSPLPHGDDDGDQRLEDLLAAYIDRLTAGERLDVEQIRAQEPDLAEALVEHLDAFAQMCTGERHGCAPLGTLGDYTLRRQIGRGGMGVVYDAWQNSMDRRVALKVLPKAIAVDTTSVTRFVREAQLAGRLDHPNVVQVHGMGLEEQVPYYAMEYVEGETLARVIAEIRDAEPGHVTTFGKKEDAQYFLRIADAFVEVADALQHAHSKGVIHRDVKPSNLILDHEGRLRILDFGLARHEGHDSLTTSGDLVGTVQYMSPEQARPRKIKVDHRTDVYSIGATLYEVLTGRPPFRGKNHAETLSQIIERDPVELRNVNKQVPKDLETIVLKCLRKDPDDRYGTAEALAQDLKRFSRGDPVEAKPQSSWERLVRRVVANRWKLAGMIAILVLLASLGVLAHELLSARRDAAHLRFSLEREIASAVADGRVAEDVLGGSFDDDLEVIHVGVDGNVYGPAISANELTLYFTRWEGSPRNNPDIYYMTRTWKGEPFKAPALPAPDLNTPHEEWVYGSCLSVDGHEIYFTSNRPGSTEKDLWAARFNVPGNPAEGFHDIKNLGPSVNAAGRQGGPIISQDGLRLYFDSAHHLYVATRKTKGDPFENPTPLGVRFGRGVLSEISPNELMVFWTTRLPGGYGNNDIWISTRESITNALKEPVRFDGLVNLGIPINSDAGESASCFTADWPRPGASLYLTRDGKKILRATWRPKQGRK